MKQLQIVAPDFVCQVWPKLEVFFDRSLAAGIDDYTVDQLKMVLVQGGATLFVILEENNIIGTFVVELINYPNHRVAFTSAMGGKAVFDEDTISQYETWARSQGVTKIRAFAKDAQARLYKMKLGLDIVTHVVEKTL